MKFSVRRLAKWEYWPFSLLYFPVFFYWLWLALKCRSLFFFTAANPGIEFGGMFGEKKSDIFKRIPDSFLPKTILVRKGDLRAAHAASEKLTYPFIAKPNVGERGNWVQKIEKPEHLASYVAHCPADFLLQEMISYPMELGVFYIRYPNEPRGKVTSVVRKDFLRVRGDGEKTVKELLLENERAVLFVDLKSPRLEEMGKKVPRQGEEVLVEPIGNHCRGTRFLNDRHEIGEDLTRAFDLLSSKISGFYFGRFDLKCHSYAELKALKRVKILELNGAGSEPAHIYQPGYRLWNAYKDIFQHLRILAEISLENNKKGISFCSFKQGYAKWKAHRKYLKMLSSPS